MHNVCACMCVHVCVSGREVTLWVNYVTALLLVWLSYSLADQIIVKNVCVCIMYNTATMKSPFCCYVNSSEPATQLPMATAIDPDMVEIVA